MDYKLIEFIILPFIAAFISTVLITPLVIYFMKKFGLMDDPNRKHPAILHKKPIPRGGGIALFFGTFIAALLLLPMSNIVVAIFLSAFIALVIGVVDDAFNAHSKEISPYFRFLGNILCALIITTSGITVPYITNPLGGILHFENIAILSILGLNFYLSSLVAILWITWVINMLNWSSGVDGQVSGVVAIAAIVIGILSLRFPLDNLVILDVKLSFIIAGASLGFLIYHFHPAKILPGYGATSLYLLVAVVSILSSAKLATAVLVLGVPTVDALFTIIRRIIAGHSPFLGDKKHLHHLLLKLGMNQRQIALFYWIISAIVGTVALQLQSRNKLFALIMLLVIVGGVLLFLHFSLRHKHEENNA
jgi:UDP-GlcNAc:undecaprenyl-phosphate/decaprenyl-phosphate GlcNAc-1-phosphate transferase